MAGVPKKTARKARVYTSIRVGARALFGRKVALCTAVVSFSRYRPFTVGRPRPQVRWGRGPTRPLTLVWNSSYPTESVLRSECRPPAGRPPRSL